MTAAAGGYRHPAPSARLVGAVLRQHDGSLDLAASYALCRKVNALHGRTYYHATRFLPRDRQHHVHALYTFARYADDVVDHLDLDWEPGRRGAALRDWSASVTAALRRGRSDDPLLFAFANTVNELGIDRGDIEAFLRSMAMDLTVTRYPTYARLYDYVHGSAAVIGAMMLPVLGARDPRARQPAMDLGVAFQLTNFLRDIGEDYERGRIYLPLEDLERFGVSEWDIRARHVSPALRALLAFEVERTRRLYQRAEAGWALLPPESRPCIRIAHRLYAAILDAIEDADYQVFRVRAAVPLRRKVAVTFAELARAALLPGRANGSAAGGRARARTTPANGQMAAPAGKCEHGRRLVAPARGEASEPKVAGTCSRDGEPERRDA